MPRLIVNLIAPLLPAIIPLILLVACASTPGRDAADACEAAERCDIVAAIDAADKAYANFNKLSTRDLCNLAASYAVIAITSGDINAADRFEDAYKASLAENREDAEKYYASLDPQMSEGLTIVAGLLAGNDLYASTASATYRPSIPDDTDSGTSPSVETEALAED